MSLRLTRQGFITSLMDLPEMRGLTAYMRGRRAFRDDAGHGGGSGGGDDDAGDEGGDSSEDEDTDDEDDKEQDAKDKSGKDKTDEDEDVVPKWKYEKLHKRMQAADRNQTELRTQLDALKNSKDINEDVKKELTDIRGQVTKLETERDQLADRNKGLTIRLAALTMSGDGIPEWENVETALRLADLSDVDVSDDGKVDKRALRSALKALAKEHPYLVKKKSKSSEGGDNEGGSTGPKMNGGRKGDTQGPDRATLAKRFPVLNRPA
jgi:hypothetical protein